MEEIEFRLRAFKTRPVRGALRPFDPTWSGWGVFDLMMMLGRNEGHVVAAWLEDDLELGRRVASEWTDQRHSGDLEYQLVKVEAWLLEREAAAPLERRVHVPHR